LTVEELIEKAKLKPFDEVNSVHQFNLPEIKSTGQNAREIAKKL
jgi:hypothetical protein